jgi:hypothetical protein
MLPKERITCSFTPAAWWNDQQTLQWIARPKLRRAIGEKSRSVRDRGKWPRNRALRNRKEGRYILAVAEDAFSGGEELAKTLAQRLGLPYWDSVALIERAATAGQDRESLVAAFESAPTLFSRSDRLRRTQLLQLQAAEATEIRNGSIVCYGAAADLLDVDARRVFRVAIQASHRARRLRVQEQLKIRGASAERYLNACDQSRRRWLLYRFGAKTGLPMGHDLVINLEQMGLDAACAAVREMICDQSRFTAADLASIESYALSACIQAALARHSDTAHLDMDVENQGGVAIVRGTVRCMEEIDSIKRVLLPVNKEVDFSHIQSNPARDKEGTVPRSAMNPKPSWSGAFWDAVLAHPARLSAEISGTILLVVAVWAVGHWLHPAETHLYSFAGVVTDSQCKFSHPNAHLTAACVRSCVKSRGAKYVLIDGARSLTLADQQRGEEFAGQRVVATGFLDDATGNLRIQSIHAVP